MNSMLENYINGNLTTAKQQAKRFSLAKLLAFLGDHYAPAAAQAVALYLKGKGAFQAACDAEYSSRGAVPA